MSNFSFSIKSLREIDFDSHPRDFSFVVGCSTFLCNNMVADFISPLVRILRKSDPTIDHFVVTTDDSIDTSEFDAIISLGEGHEINIENHNMKQISNFLTILKNNELSDFLQPQLNLQLDINNCVDKLLLKEETGQPVSNEISFISSHLYKLDKDELDKLDFDNLYGILSDSSLCIKSEEWLFDLIFSKFSQESEIYGNLFEFIDFRFLPKNQIKQFLNFFFYFNNNNSNNSGNDINEQKCRNFDKENYCIDLNFGVLNAILKRFECQIVFSESGLRTNTRRYKMKKTDYDYNGHNPLNGIIKYLTTKNGNLNIAKSKVINISSSSVFSSSEEYLPENVVDLETDTYFFSNCGPEQWICIDFKERKVIPKFYTFKSINTGSNNHQPRSWVVEVSNDGQKWIEVDKKEGNSLLNLKNVVGTFSIASPTKCQYIKFKLTGKTAYDTDNFVVAGIEVFGRLFELEE